MYTDVPDEFGQPRMASARRKVLVPLLLVLGACLVVVGGYFVLRGESKPEKLLIAIRTISLDGTVGQWWGVQGKPSARLSDEVAKLAGRLGLSPVESGAPEVAAEMSEVTDSASLVDAARSLGAGFTLTGEWVFTDSKPVSGSAYTDFSYELRFYLLDTESGERVELPQYPLYGWITSEDEEKAFLDTAEFVARRVYSPLAGALATHPRLASYNKEAQQVPTTRAALATKLEPLFELAKRRVTATKNFEDKVKTSKDEWDRQDLAPKVKTPVGQFQAEEYFLGTTANGLILFEKPRSLEILADEYGWVYVEGQERVVLADADGTNRKPIFGAYNFFSYPGVTPDGDWAAVVVDNHSWSKSLYLLDLANGGSKELLTSRNDYYSTPRLSPDGKRIAYWFRTCYECADSLNMVDVVTGKETELVPTGFSYASMPSWSPDGKRLFMALRSSRGGVGFLLEIDAASGQRKPLEGDWAACDGYAAGFSEVVTASDGRTLWTLETCGDEEHIGIWDLTSGKYERLLAGEFDGLRVAPDGRRAAVRVWRWEEERDDYRSDSEVGVVDAKTKSLQLLTINGVDDHVMGWSPDGVSVYIHEAGTGVVNDEWCNRIYRVEP